MEHEPSERPVVTTDGSTDPRVEVRERTRRQLIAVAISAAVLVVAGVVTLVLLGGANDEGDDGDGPGTGPTTPDTGDDQQDPDAPGGAHPSGLDPSHPLVGRTELEAREIYPLVRAEWVDGEALVLTMDLVPGRVGVALADGVIVAAGAEGCDELPAEPAAWQRQACNPSPDDGATVWGRLIEREGELALEPGTGADRYYEYMRVVPLSARSEDDASAGSTIVIDLEGGAVDQSELQPGQSVWLWISGNCEERYPVSCTVDALVVER